ncbi:MAG: response regulator [Nitrospirae bacterium]|nr:response regulator [Nitrospirota bacterium]
MKDREEGVPEDRLVTGEVPHHVAWSVKPPSPGRAETDKPEVLIKEVLRVVRELSKGNFKARMRVHGNGTGGELASLLNGVIGLNAGMAREFERIRRVVGREGKLTQRAALPEAKGSWQDSVDSLNAIIGDLIQPTAEVIRVIGAVAQGDLSQTMKVKIEDRPLKGEYLRAATTINTMVQQLSAFASEVSRVAREVGTEGKLGGQADVRGVSGTWKDLTDNVNRMAANLTGQVRNIAEVTTAVAKGDLSRKITVDVKGEILALKNTINTMVDQLGAFASEVTRVAREVGTEGKLGGQADVKGVSGTWKDLTDNVNRMAANLTGQVRNIAEVTTAVAKGDLSRKITVDVKGEILALKNTINVMVDQLGAFASEVTRVAREVGTEGKLGGQARVKGVSGTWKDLTDNVNRMAANLTGQVRNIAEVTTAVAKGDLSRKITVDVKGEILALKNTINVMVDQLSGFASEVTRVAREVGTEGKLGGQARVKGVSGTWKDLTDNVNRMAANLTGQVRNIAEVTVAVAKGDLSRKITVDVKGEILALKSTINTMVDQLGAFASEVTRVAREVGTEGKLGGQADVKGVSGTWKDLTDNVNRMAANLTGQVRNIAEVTTAVAKGDLSRKITVDVKGEILTLKNTINTMVDQLSAFASEVTRVARDVGTEGKLGGQADVKGVSGTWKDLTDNVNQMAANLTDQVRGIAKVVTAVATGDLKKKVAFEVKGEIASLADTINEMIDTLAIFADQVTTVAREVGVEGRLGGQARVPGAAGIWKDLTENVNQLAANLTTQVRAIGDVATAVTKGDLTRSIAVETRGEVEALKNNINEMIRNLKETTEKNTQQDWLKTNLARFAAMIQGQRDLVTVSRLIMSELAALLNAQQGVFYIHARTDNGSYLSPLASYAHRPESGSLERFQLGEGLIGQCALEKKRILLANVPAGFVQIASALGKAQPRSVVVLPILFEGETRAVIELASFDPFSEIHLTFIDQLAESIGIMINTIAATMRTEELLQKSQALAQELQGQQLELKKTNEELAEKAHQLAEQKTEVERKNREVELARKALEEKAEQLSLTSKYKSEFLANMSHELRTPLNSLLILAKMLSENSDRNLTDKQVEFSRTIHGSGTDLLNLINDILDLSKIEAGKMTVDVADVYFDDLKDYVERGFRQVAVQKSLEFSIELGESLPKFVQTDAKRLQQVLKNLLSNAFKFTARGKVLLRIDAAREGWTGDQSFLTGAESVLAFSVIDTGIGIPLDKQKIIFEAFQQAEGGTSRKYGGTGLGLSISRELSRLLCGEIGVVSTPGAGSVFTLYLPARFPKTIGVAAEIRAAEAAASVQERGADVSEIQIASFARRELVDDRELVEPGDRLVLIVDDDPSFGHILWDLAHEKGFKGVVAERGEEGMALARRFKPDAVTLDIRLPDMDGWSILDRLKHDAETRHIPVYIITATEDRDRGYRLGAAGCMEKVPNRSALAAVFDQIRGSVEKRKKRVLVIEDNATERQSLTELLSDPNVDVVAVASAEEALPALSSGAIDCAILDLRLPGLSGIEFLEKAEKEAGLRHIPVIVYTGKDLSPKEERKLRRFAQSIIVKDAESPERLLAETALYLHQRMADLPLSKRQMIRQVQQVDRVLQGKKVLVVDDDIRNIYAVTSILETQKMNVLHAGDGREGIRLLKDTPDVDVVLMDIMMPEMDGYETMREIRKDRQFKSLPILALTAKAMKGDREKCIEAGASDYIAKPVDPDQLLSLLRVSLDR